MHWPLRQRASWLAATPTSCPPSRPRSCAWATTRVLRGWRRTCAHLRGLRTRSARSRRPPRCARPRPSMRTRCARGTRASCPRARGAHSPSQPAAQSHHLPPSGLTLSSACLSACRTRAAVRARCCRATPPPSCLTSWWPTSLARAWCHPPLLRQPPSRPRARPRASSRPANRPHPAPPLAVRARGEPLHQRLLLIPVRQGRLRLRHRLLPLTLWSLTRRRQVLPRCSTRCRMARSRPWGGPRGRPSRHQQLAAPSRQAPARAAGCCLTAWLTWARAYCLTRSR
mmetsp:Transcript_13905/g.34257  ORF Transcript_13905/g.34257 Transcript_13905/m.34257 type:complete len:284 (+) Transcript_13905:1994-2845(+)